LERNEKILSRFLVGDELFLRVSLPEYRDGDILWVCLPDCLSRIIGGGQVKRFSVDFRGAREVVVPLVATSITIDQRGAPRAQRFALCVRNMFEEERIGSTGPVEVLVTSQHLPEHKLSPLFEVLPPLETTITWFDKLKKTLKKLL
jgi:hypothetical protein